MSASVAPTVTIGANFPGSNVSVSGLVPPDSDGAVGPGQFVELVNGSYRVYDKTGTLLQQSSLNGFWQAAGISDVGLAYDPRVLYHPVSQRWFAASSENPRTPHPMLVAVSNTSDPTQGWRGVEIPFDFGGQYWADFPKLGIDQDGVFISATMVPFFDNFHAGRIIIPKADLLQAVPSATNASVLLDPQEPEIDQQPAVAFQSSGSEPFLAGNLTLDGQLKITSVDGPVTSPTVNTSDRVVSVPPTLGPDFATQKGTDVQVNTGPVIFNFSSSAVLQGGKLFAVQGVDQPGVAALRWFEIGDPLTNPTVLDSGIIRPPGLNVYYGSIAVNPLGQAVIGFSGSGPNDYPSAYAVAGTLNGDTLTFGDPILLKAGVAPDTSGRFGDYSATTYDPTDPSHFWTIQEWTSEGSQWSTEISEVNFGPAPSSVQTWFGGTGDFSDPNNWIPPGSPIATDTLVINAGGVRADNLTISNPNIQLGSPTSTPTLVLKDSTLADTNSIRVRTTTFDPSEAEVQARIRVLGAVTDNGAIDVGTTGIDVNQLFPSHLTMNIARDSSFTLSPSGIWFSSDGSTIDVNAREHGSAFVNNGTIEAFGGTVTMNVSVSGQGTFDIVANNNAIRTGTVEFREDVGSGEKVRLDAGLLKLDEPMKFLGRIEDFNSASRIELVDTKATSLEYDPNNPGVLNVFDNHRLVAALDIVGNFTTDQFNLARQDDNTFITLAQPSNDAAAAMPMIPTVNQPGFHVALATGSSTANALGVF